MLYVACSFLLEQSSSASLLNENVSKCLDIFVSVVWTPRGSVSTRVIESWPSSTKSDKGIRGMTISFLIRDDSNSNPRMNATTHPRTEAFLITVALEGGFGANQLLPCITAQRGSTVLTISNEGIQWGCCPIHSQEPGYSIDLHTETDLGKGRAPVRW